MELKQQVEGTERTVDALFPVQTAITDTEHATVPQQVATVQGRSVDEWLQQYANSVKRRQVRKKVGIGLAVTGGFISVGAIGTFIAIGLLTNDWSHAAWLMGFTGFSGFTGFVGLGMVADAKQRAAAGMLAEADDVRAIGPLAEALEFPPTELQFELRRRAQQALTRLLPRLQASDVGLLNAYQRGCLYRALGRSMQSELSPDDEALAFILAILKALEQVGDRKAIPAVRQLLKARPAWSGERLEQIHEAAESCLQFLQARTDQEAKGQELLRASRMPGATPETLLRAAQGAGPTPPEQLLRSTAAKQNASQD
jgi:hypothetical protein